MTLALLCTLAWAGYGDLDEDGLPLWQDRELHLWTNAARVDPEAFEVDYNAGGCSFDDFSTDEQTPKAPVYLDLDLYAAAVYHSEDMESSGNFSHSSSDGTSFGDRLAQFYSDSSYIGENIAYGYGSAYATVFNGWMCSTEGHRANIMSGDYNELGAGVSGAYMTQDFAAGSVQTDSPIAMGLHSPESPSNAVEFLLDWQDDAAPDRLEIILDGAPVAPELLYGADDQGIYTATVGLDDGGACHVWYVRWARADGSEGVYPEEGSYTFGACDSARGWTASQMCVLGRDCRDAAELAQGIELIGCASARGPASLGAALGALLLLSRRRSR